MNKFIENGVERQNRARNANHAKWCFGYSCELCCSRGLQLKCENCPIQQAHKDALERFGEHYIEEEY